MPDYKGICPKTGICILVARCQRTEQRSSLDNSRAFYHKQVKQALHNGT